ncbi:uncharacterized protein LOC127781722 [Oryza glaberrima]|uniref:uncharacterized protein LOC127781722 n=1 Tax=Oryza glaberrima TaxID=4538 RepID=UPI00224C1FE0|nr:uncharacterized protein LOC127781722 [Oryza glaberrima]
MQLYFYDTEEDTDLAHRANRSPDLDINLVRIILRILADNPYVETFNRVGSMPNLDDYKIEINTNVTPDQRRYNALTTSQVAAIWLEGDDPVRTFDRHVMVHAKGEKPSYIKAYHGCYDPLAYPLFNPNGETGWNVKMPYETPNNIPDGMNIDAPSAAQMGGNVRVSEENTFGEPPENDDVGNTLYDEDTNEVDNRSCKRKKDRFVTAREYYCFRLQGVVDVINSGETRGKELQLHLPNMQYVAYDESGNLEDVVNKPSNKKTTLTEFFEMNRKDPKARKLLYKEFLEHYRWVARKNVWQKRKTKTCQVGRIVYAHPAEGERYYLRVLLNHVRGPTSHEHLRTVCGITYSTCREACEKSGLVETDMSHDDCLSEAATFQMPYALRRLFATILAYCEVTDICALWHKHKESMSEDYARDNPNPMSVEQMVLRDIRDTLHSMGKDISDYGLPELTDTYVFSNDTPIEVREEQSVPIDPEHLDIYKPLNDEQRAGFDDIIQHVIKKKSQVFFVDGPGGTGKTFLYKALLARVRSDGLIAIATATSSIAASILLGGRTAHSRFKIPIKLAHNSMCNFTKQSGTTDLLRRASLIIWDEAAMTKRQAVETLDRSLQDIMDNTLPFGGKVIVFGGDFRQVLPVVTRGTRAQITDATLQRSYLWKNIRKISLSHNMRAQSDPWFSDYLLRIGNGTENTIIDDYVHLPDEIVIGYLDNEDSVNTLIEYVFPSLDDERNTTSVEYMSTRAILSTKNDFVDKLNMKMIDRFPRKEKIYHSFDSVDDDTQNSYPLDFLNTITPNGLPPHELKVKVNCPVILLRNLDPNNGLCNGTRLMVRAFQDNAIDAEIVGGQHANKRLYIALSRGVSRQTTRILAKPKKEVDLAGKSTKNIVYKDILDW